VPGWLLLVVRRHVAGLHELHDDEAAGLARWLVPTCRALHQVTGCEVEYLAQVADGATGSHLHLHIVARGRHWPRPKTGMSVLREIGDAGNRPLSDRAVAVFMQRMAVALDPARS
jgi:diadenosine tetraphosphate (Ap4A) HIT family hydrolase